MKASIITRIVIYSVLILVLCGLLVAGIMGGNFGFGIGMSMDYDDERSYTSADGEIVIDGNTIDKIEIEWISGDITIFGVDDSDNITFRSEIAEKDWQNMQYRVKDGVLSIKFCKPRMIFGNIGSKDMNIYVPADKVLKEIDIECISGDVKQGTQGMLKAENINIQTVSGRTNLSVLSDSIDCESVSGHIDITAGNNLRDGDFETVSADVNLTFMTVEGIKGFGFEAQFDSVSGSIRSDYETSGYDNILVYDVYGTPTCELDFDTVSGNVNIKSANKVAR